MCPFCYICSLKILLYLTIKCPFSDLLFNIFTLKYLGILVLPSKWVVVKRSLMKWVNKKTSMTFIHKRRNNKCILKIAQSCQYLVVSVIIMVV